MHFFKKIISIKKSETNDNLRENKFKDKKYFLQEIDRINKWEIAYIDNQKEFFEQNGKLLDSHFYANFTLFLKRIEVYYTIGKSPFELKEAYNKLLENLIKSSNETPPLYTDLLTTLSFSVLLNAEEKTLNELESLIPKIRNNNNKHDNVLLWFLLKQDIKIDPSKINNYLIKATQTKNSAITYLKKYLDNWYQSNKGQAWYDSHKRQWGYSGYWSWEAAAVVKLMKIDDSSIKDHPYYPYDLVHWNDKKS